MRCKLTPNVRIEIEHFQQVCIDELGTPANHDEESIVIYHALAYGYQCLLDGDLGAAAASCSLLADELHDKAEWESDPSMRGSLRRLARRLDAA